MATEAAKKSKKRRHWGEVRSKHRLSAGLIRIVLGGDGLREFEAGQHTDHYVKVQIPPPGAPYSAPFDLERIKAERPRDSWPRTRSITVRYWDPDKRQLTLDFVDHGPAGFAGPWAAAAEPGDILQMQGPGGGYSPDREADWHLMVGDLAALPAIAASLERVTPGVPTLALLGVDRDEDRIELRSDGELELRWVSSGELDQAVEDLDLPAGRGQAFIHGEAEMVRTVRRHLVVERGMEKDQLSASGYWKRDRSDEAWRAEKSEWKRLAEADLRPAG